MTATTTHSANSATSPAFGSLKQIEAGLLNVERLAEGPVITVPTITLEGDANGAPHPEPRADAGKFSGTYAHRTIEGGIGHNLPQEAPEAFAQAVIDVDTD
jgi:pimeloyl-ACP methyl ester carboxylesterase